MPETCVRIAVPAPEGEDGGAALFERLHHLSPEAPAAFLDSSDHRRTSAPARSRFSILAFSMGPEARIHRDAQGFDQVGQLFPAHPTSVPDHDPPFQLGWVGYVGYESQTRFFRTTHAVVIDHHRGSAEVQTATADPQWERWVRTAITDLNGLFRHTGGQPGTGHHSAPPALSRIAVRDSRTHYLQKVRAAQEEIRQGNSYEVCLTTAVSAQLCGDPWAAYTVLRRANRAPFTQYQFFPGPEPVALLSTSPERFVQITAEGRMRSEPIKGTRPRGTDPDSDAALKADLAAHPKDRAENVMIADLVRNDLSIHTVPGSLRTERLCAVETYPTVHQMVSTISAQLGPEAARAAALAGAFPPGSMTGAPKLRTMEILRRLEGAPRGPYSGVAGYISDTGACDFSVLIRTAVLVPAEIPPRGTADPLPEEPQWSMHLGIGGAVTADSVPEGEWEEIIAKSRGVLTALGSEFPQS